MIVSSHRSDSSSHRAERTDNLSHISIGATKAADLLAPVAQVALDPAKSLSAAKSPSAAASPPSYRFWIKSNEGDIIKILFDLLSHNMTTMFLNIRADGISSRIFDTGKKISMFDLRLRYDNFVEYHCAQDIAISFQTKQISKMMKIIKKKSTITLFLEEGQLNRLGIRVCCRNTCEDTTSYITVQSNVQNIIIDTPTIFHGFHVIPSQDFYKLCRSINSVGNDCIIRSTADSLLFICNSDDTYMRQTKLEVPRHLIAESDEAVEEIEAKFFIKVITNIMKLGQLSLNLRMYVSLQGYIKLESNVGTLGQIEVYVRPKKE